MSGDESKRLRDALKECGVEYEAEDRQTNMQTYWGDWCFIEPLDAKPHTLGAQCELMCIPATPEQAIAATLGSDRDEIYNAGFDSGVKACLQILDGYLDYPHSAAENIQKWVDEQWKEYES